jgi:hypothetical protein
MRRRLVAILGTLALAVAYLPAVTGGLAAGTPECCTSGLCPMRNVSGGHLLCDMDLAHPHAAFESCPPQAPHYTVASDLIRVEPPGLAPERPSGAAPVFAMPSLPHADSEVASPPPRTSLA